MQTAAALNPWAVRLDDPIRRRFESAFFDRLIGRLLDAAPGARVLDLGCGDGLLLRLGGSRIERYLGVDLFPPPDVPALRWDLREGLGPATAQGPFDVFLGTFGVASHVTPAELWGLLADIAAAAAPGAIVAVEALGLYSLEWPAIWAAPPGQARLLSYRLTGEVLVHPWLPEELRALFAASGLQWLGALDRTVQAGPKLGDYWPGLPPVRAGLAALAAGDIAGTEPLRAPLPPLPAYPATRAHHALARSRRALVKGFEATGLEDPSALATAIWALEPGTGSGLGHGIVALGRVRG